MPTALVSVYDKTGIAECARELHALGWSLMSSGGTASVIAEAGVPVTDVAEVTGVPAILGHRVVTLHPKVHGGILANRSDPNHQADLERFGIDPIDLVIANLYPFSSDPGVELIDIGGPAMVRAAAKNHADVAVVVSPRDYQLVVEEIREHGVIRAATRRRLARDAFAHTAAYDASIVRWFDETDDEAATEELPRTLHLALERVETLRYGENPHQIGARYRDLTSSSGAAGWWQSVTQHGGKAMSYLNVYDTEAAWRLAHQFEQPTAVVVKHANPCGVASADTIEVAYSKAHQCDPVSAFGGIVAVNRPVTRSMAESLAPVFTEVVVAPGYEDGALEVLTAKANLRVLSASEPQERQLDVRSVDGGLLVQTADTVLADRRDWSVVTEVAPTNEQWADIEFAWRVCAAVSSNAIVYAKDQQAFGIGAGQQNRLDSSRIAAERSAGRADGGVCAIDAFFPFTDGLDAAVAAGIRAVVQPGGSVRDDEVIAVANKAGIAMVFTGRRHFRH